MPLLIINIIAIISLAYYIWQHRHMRGGRPLFWLGITIAWWAFAYALTLSASDDTLQVFWFKTRFFGIVFSPVAWLFLALTYAGYERWLTPRHLLLVSLIPCLTLIIVWTNSHLMWQQLQPVVVNGLNGLKPTYGSWFGVHVAYSNLVGAGGMWLLLRMTVQNLFFYRWQTAVWLIVVCITWVLSNLIGLGISQIDLAPFTLSISFALLTWGIIQQKLLEIRPIARNLLIETLQDIVIVLDTQNHVIDLNAAALNFIQREAKQVIGRPATAVFAQWQETFLPYQDIVEAQTVVTLMNGDQPIYLDMTISPIRQQEQLVGRLFIFRNATSHTQLDTAYRETLQQLQARTQELETLHQIELALTANLDLDQALTAVMNMAVRLLDIDQGVLFLYNAQEDSLEVATRFQYDLLSPIGRKVQPGQGLVGKVWEQDKGILLNNYQQWTEKVPEFVASIGSRSCIGIPIHFERKKIGVIVVTSKIGHNYTQNDLILFEKFALIAALAIHNAQLYQNLQTELAERKQIEETLRQNEAWLISFNNLIQTYLPIQELDLMLQLVIDQIGELFKADGCFITLWDEAQARPIPAAAYGSFRETYPKRTFLPDEVTITESVLRLEQVLVLEDMFNSPYLSPRIAAQFPARSMMALPLIAGEQKLGAALIAFDQPYHFTAVEIEQGTQVARVIALAVARSRAYVAVQQEMENRRLVESQLRAVMNSAPIILFSLDQEGIFQLSEGKGLENLGLQAGEVIGRSVFEVYQDVPDAVAAVRRALAGDAFNGIVHTGPVAFNTWFAPQYDSDNNLSSVLGVALDVTTHQQELVERKRIEVELRESEERYRDLFDNASDLIQSLDVDGRFLYVNPSWLRTLQYTTAEIATMEFPDIIRPDCLDDCLEILRRISIAEPSHKMETVFVSKAGQPFNVEGHVTARFEDGHLISVQCFFHDITERKRAETLLYENEEWLRSILASMDDLVFVLDRQGKFLDYYQPAQKDTYVPSNLFLGKSFAEVLPPLVTEKLTAVLQKITQAGQVENFEYSLPADNQEQWFHANISGRNNRHDEFDGVTIVIRDVTAYKQAVHQLRQIAHFDALTGLSNRRLFMEQLDEAIQYKKQRNFSLLFLDLDRFKIINDSLGHQVGDQLLIAIARLLESCVREYDLVARLGGDEFVVLLRHMQDVEEAQQAAERILERIAQPFFLNGHTVHTSASIGLIAYTAHYENPDEVLRHADLAMYQAKLGGKARYELFDLGQQELVTDLWQIEQDLRRALEGDELLVFYQPIVSLGDGRPLAIEALVRWQHPQRGLLDPDVFLSVAEEAGLITAINERVLQKASKQLQAWHQAGHDFLRLTVNISAVQLHQGDALITFIQETLQQTDLLPYMLGLEITERFSARTKEHMPVLTALHDLGIGILIDDFGIASSLESLKLFPLDYLKINQAFIKGTTHDLSDQAVITAIIAMAHSLDLQVIAEGVETANQLAYLKAKGCDEAQGFFICPPLSATEMSKWLQEREKYTLETGSYNKTLSVALRTHFAEHISYALVGKDLKILKSNDTIRQWTARHITPLEGQLVTDIFPALVGCEEVMQKIINHSQAEPLLISRIYFPAADEFGRYYDLRVEAFAADTAVLLLTLQEATQQARQEFTLRQRLNELRFALKE